MTYTYDDADNMIQCCLALAEQKNLDTSFLLSNEKYVDKQGNPLWSAGISNRSQNLPLGEIEPEYESKGETAVKAIKNLITLLIQAKA